jgi:Flp pilus assembly protein TadG
MIRILDRRKQRRTAARQRRGTIIILTALLLIMLMAMLAYSIDIGYMQNVSVEMDRAVDAGALAGAGALIGGAEEATDVAREFTRLNPVAGRLLKDSEVDIILGEWDKDSKEFSDYDAVPYAVQVRARRVDVPLFFGRVLGRRSFTIVSDAVAMYQPRDMVLVLDYSASMNDDSELRSIGTLGREAVEANLTTIYQELGSPVYGTLAVAPQWIKVNGPAPSNQFQPQITLEYRYKSAYLTSTKPFIQVRVYRSSTSYVTYNGTGTYNSALGVYEQTVTYDNSRQNTKYYVKSGYESSDTSTSNQHAEWFNFDSDTAIRQHAKNSFGLTSVSYPYPAGSWDDYIDYCRQASTYNSNAGYRYKFGYLNLVNYWLEKRPQYDETPDLWKTSEQPITALKNAVDVFLAFLQEMETDDQLALAVYNSSSGNGLVERRLAQDFDEIGTISRQRQAGHYHNNTNIGAGLYEAWNELEQNARSGSFKMIVLMTDGIANMPTSDPIGYVMDQVTECQSRGYPVVTVSLGAGADTDLMQQIADMTGGVHFNVPGGQSVAEYEEDLKEVFRQIAAKRPLQLVR